MSRTPSTSPPPKASQQAGGPYRLLVSSYDQTAGMLLALLIVIGLLVTIMVAIWLSSQVFTSQKAVPVTMEEIGSDEDPWGPGDDIEPPAPQETDIEEEEIEEVIEAVSDAVATRTAMLERRISGDGKGRGGGGTGHGRKGKPRRWEVQFLKGNTLDTYAKQLDFFGIELGVLLPDNRVEYAYNLVRTRPTRRVGPADQDKRYYRTWRSGDLQEADRQLLARAGIQAGRRLILKFLPRQTEEQLYTMEQAKAEGRSVAATRFGVEPDGKGYRFTIIRQTYR